MLPNREGRYLTTPLEWGLSKTRQAGLPQFECKFRLDQELSADKWVPVELGLEITGYFTLQNKDGQLNAVNVRNLKEALGWPAVDVSWLQNTDLSQCVVQLTLEWTTYKDKQSMRVKYINAADAEPSGITRANETMLREFETKLGSKLRAHSGGVPAPAPMPIATAPSMAPPPDDAPMPEAREITKQDVWDAFKSGPSKDWDEKRAATEWFRLLAESYPNREIDTLTPQEWEKFVGVNGLELVLF